MKAYATEEPGWVYWDDDKGKVPDDQRRRNWSPFITWAAENHGSSLSGPDRRGRASMISAARRAWLKANPGHALFLLSKSYSEGYGFTHQTKLRYRAVPCDAVTGGRPAGNCSDDLVQLWHGKDTPALACGYHEKNFKDEVYAGYTARTAYDADQVTKIGGRVGHSTWPYKP